VPLYCCRCCCCCYYKIWQKFDSNGYNTIADFDKNYEKKESYVQFVVRILYYAVLCIGDDNNNNNNHKQNTIIYDGGMCL